MASALLASRNEPYWGERKVYMRKNPNSSNPFRKTNPNPNPNHHNPNPRKQQIYDPSTEIHGHQTISDDSSSMIKRKPTPTTGGIVISNNHNNHHHHRRGESLIQNGYVTFNISAYSKRELKDLKKRLMLELDQVRKLYNRIESREIQSRSGYSVSHFSGGGGVGGGYGGGGREVTSATTRPPPLHVSFSDSPVSDGLLKEKRTTPRTNFRQQSEFLIGGKEKMPPLPSESKKLSGNKRPNPFVPTRDLKRPASEVLSTGKLLSTMMKTCGQILTKLMKSKTGYIFNKPVDIIGMKLHDYTQIIRNPMDLGTVRYKLDNDLYETPLDFAADVRLTFDNALMYNPKGHDVNMFAQQLLNRFNSLFEPAYKKFEDEQRCIVAAGDAEMRRNSISLEEALPSPRSRLSTLDSARTHESIPMLKPMIPKSKQALGFNPPPRPPPPPPPPLPAPAPQTMEEPPAPTAVEAPRPSFIGRPSMGKLPKPKAKDPNKREMSYDEKQKLSAHLMNLPQDKMSQALQIVKRRRVVLLEKGDEVELDFEVLDRETLWELDRFVCNFRKMLSKVRRQAGVGNQNHTASDGSKSPVSEMPEIAVAATSTASVKTNRRVENVGGEEDVDIGEDIPTSSFPPVEIEKEDPGNASSGSSSSSSSSSDSSSSDSDSGSSSGSDSDEDEAQSPLMEPKAASSPRS